MIQEGKAMYICKKYADGFAMDMTGQEIEPKASTCYVCSTYTGVYKVPVWKVMTLPRWNDTVEVIE